MQNVLDLLQAKGLDPVKVSGTHGGEYHSPCPASGSNCIDLADNTDRFHVWPEQNAGKGSWWCRKCNKGGDDITFVMEFDGLTYKQACRRLGHSIKSYPRFHTPRPAKERHQPTAHQLSTTTPQDPPERWIEKATAFSKWAHDRLLESRTKLDWLRKRGITRATIRTFRLGWNPGKDGKDLFRPREFWALPTEYKKQDQKKRLWIPRGLIIPLLEKDMAIRIRIRRDDDKPRYYVIPGSSMKTMLIGPLEARAFIVVESELDAILIEQAAGDIITVLGLGSASAKPHTSICNALKRSALILLALDYDTAGARALEWWEHEFPQSEWWPVPDGKDPTDAYQAGLDLYAWVCAGLPPGWHIGRLDPGKKKKGGSTQKASCASSAVRELAQLLKRHPVSIRVTAERTHIRESQKWVRENWKTSRRISELVFMCPEVAEYLEIHAAEVITGENILQEN